MRHPLNVLLRVGRSKADRVSLLGDLAEECDAQLARGHRPLSVFAWYTKEILVAFGCGMRDLIARRGTSGRRPLNTSRLHRLFSWPDLKLSARLLIKHPGLTLVATVGFTVGTAITAGAFAFLYGALYPHLPLDDGDRIVALENWNIAVNNEERHTLHDLAAWRDQMTSVSEVSAFQTVDAILESGRRGPEVVRIAEMTASGFRVARVSAMLGRSLGPDDERASAAPVLVIGYDVWQSRFGGNRAVVGEPVRIGNTIHTIVGVMPEGFRFPVNHQYWTAFRHNPNAYARGSGPAIFIFGRLGPGATMTSAQAELAAIGVRSATAFPATHGQLKPRVLPYTRPINDIQDEGIDWSMFALQILISLVSVIIAFNVAVLVYARTASRRGEIAVRTALGASRGRIVTQLFAEALLLALTPAVIGLLLAQRGATLATTLMAEQSAIAGVPPFWTDYSVRPATVVYLLGVVIVTAAIVGVLPALHATRRTTHESLRELSGSTGIRLGRLWSVFIVAQVAIAVAVLPAVVGVGLGQMRDGLTRYTYPLEEFVSAELNVDQDATPLGQRWTELKRRLEAEASVAGVTFTASLPGRNIAVPFEAQRGSFGSEPARVIGIDLDYLRLHGARLVAGRALDRRDVSDVSNPVIVNRAFVRKILKGDEAIGRRIRPMATDPRVNVPPPWFEIVGVAEDLQSNPIDPDAVNARVFYPVTSEQVSRASLIVRFRGPARISLDRGFAYTLADVTASIDRSLQLGAVRLVDEASRKERSVVELTALAVGLLMLTVLLLSAAGVHALMSFTVTQRWREIGIRTALGGAPHRVLGSIFSRVGKQVGLGVVIGLGGAIAIESAAGGLVMKGQPAIAIPVITLIVIAVGVLAAIGPARRGLRIAPTDALKTY